MLGCSGLGVARWQFVECEDGSGWPVGEEERAAGLDGIAFTFVFWGKVREGGNPVWEVIT